MATMMKSAGLKAVTSRRSAVVCRAGKYDEELMATAVRDPGGRDLAMHAREGEARGSRANPILI